MKKWVCQKNREHTFDDPDPNPEHPYYCTIDGPFEGILREEEVGPGPFKSFKPYSKPIPPDPNRVIPETGPEDEVGLCIIMIDASDSMTNYAFPYIPLTRLTLTANSAACGIFDLARMQSNSTAYIAIYKFGEEVEQIFMDSVANLIKTWKNIDAFSKEIYKRLLNPDQQKTDINKALQQAHLFVRQFLNKQLEGFPVKDYIPMPQTVFFNHRAARVPNVRVLIYTDGIQFQGPGVLNPNPFKQNPLKELEGLDILIGAFFGAETDEGCKELRSLVSNCPIHKDIPKFFLFDDPANIGTLKHLFRMASGPSGFCEHCMNQLK